MDYTGWSAFFPLRNLCSFGWENGCLEGLFCVKILFVMTSGEFLGIRRKKLGIGYRRVAKELNYSAQAIYCYEKGKARIPLELVLPLCKVLDISLDSFFRKDPDFVLPFEEKEEFSKERFCLLLKHVLSHRNLVSLCRVLKTSEKRIQRWENGESLPTLDEFLVLSRFLGMNPVDLFFGREKKEIDRFSSRAFLSEMVEWYGPSFLKGRLLAYVSSFFFVLLVSGCSFFFLTRSEKKRDDVAAGGGENSWKPERN